MKPTSSLCLGLTALLAAGRLTLSAADVPKLISAPPPSPAIAVPSGSAAARANETAAQKSARHGREVQAAQAQMNQLAKALPLLTATNAAAQRTAFQAELGKLRGLPEFKPAVPTNSIGAPGRPPAPKSAAQRHAEQRQLDLALMRRQADRILADRPELRDYVEQQFEWHQRLFELGGQYLDNPHVHQLIRRRLEATPAARPQSRPQPTTKEK